MRANTTRAVDSEALSRHDRATAAARSATITVARRARYRLAGLCITLLASAGCGLVPDVIVEPEGATATSEDGASSAVSVRLARAPSRTVTVRAISSDPSEGRVSAPLTFDRSNWDEPQTITVSGVDDTLSDGDVAYRVTFEASAPHAPARVVERLDFVNRDDDLASFVALGDLSGGEVASVVSDVSGAGDVVVGYSATEAGNEAVRWTRALGLVGLGSAPSCANGVSPDGSLIVGTAANPDPDAIVAIWRADEVEFWRGGPDITPGYPPLFSFVQPLVITNGSSVFGQCTQYGAFNVLGCRQDAPGLITLLTPLSIVYAADPSGNHAGARVGNRYDPTISVAMLNGADLPYPADAFCITPGTCASEARAFSAGAAAVVGVSNIYPPRANISEPAGPLTETAWLYTSAGGTERLPDLPGGDAASGAYDISSDGRVIGGFGSDESGRTAVVWIDRAPIALSELVANEGGSVPAGYRPLEVRALSADGRVLVGNGTNAAGNPEGFWVELPAAP